MQPGRETDARVAEVLGWTHPGTVNWPQWGYPPGLAPEYANLCAVPRYSTSNSDAIAGLEATGEDYEIYRDRTREPFFIVAIVTTVGQHGAEAPTLPLAAAGAICKWGERPRPAAEETAP